MAEVAVELGGVNVPMSDLAAAFGPNGEETMASRKPSSFVTVCRMGRSGFAWKPIDVLKRTLLTG